MKIKTYIIGLLALASISCNDWLAEKPSKTTSLTIETTDHLEYLLNNYSNFYQEANSTAIYSSDDYGLYTEMYDVHNSTYGIEAVEFATWDIDNLPNESSDGFWTSEYEKIFTANMVLEYLPEVSGSEETKANLEAEAHFVRAYSLWELANTYCLPYTGDNGDELGLVLKQTTSFDESTVRATLEETYTQIETDLEAALKINTELTMQNNKYRTWRASLPAVHAFAARYYLFRGNYSEALNYANLALEEHGELVDYNTEMRYSDNESTVVINSGTDEQETVEILYPYTHDNQIDMTDMLEWKEFYYFRMLYHSSWWFCPSQELMDLYDKEYDLRWKYHYVENYSYDRGLTSPAYEWPGYIFFFKDRIPSGPTVAEMLLIKAECQARTGNFGDAMTTVNQLRAARMDNTAPADRINLSASSQQDAITKILQERRREMPFTMRWFDIRRLNSNDDPNDDVGDLTRTFYPYTSASIQGNETAKTYTLEKNSRRYAQPILNSEIQSSQGAIQQNTY